MNTVPYRIAPALGCLLPASDWSAALPALASESAGSACVRIPLHDTYSRPSSSSELRCKIRSKCVERHRRQGGAGDRVVHPPERVHRFLRGRDRVIGAEEQLVQHRPFGRRCAWRCNTTRGGRNWPRYRHRHSGACGSRRNNRSARDAPCAPGSSSGRETRWPPGRYGADARNRDRRSAPARCPGERGSAAPAPARG